MNKVVIACAVLVALAIFAAPALAKPVTKVTWGGSGVTDSTSEIMGAQMKFSGSAYGEYPGQFDGGSGTFVITGSPLGSIGSIKGSMTILQGRVMSPDRIALDGAGSITTLSGTTLCSFEITLDKSIPQYRVLIDKGVTDNWFYGVSGDAFKGKIRMR